MSAGAGAVWISTLMTAEYCGCMRAIQVAQHGGPEVLVPAELPDPEPGPGDLLVRTDAIGVNFIDTYFRTGLYGTELPHVPGSEGTGTVVAVGSDVDDVTVGQRVAWCAAPGSYAELVRVPATVAVPVPDAVPVEQAAAVLLQGMTAHYLIESTYPAQPGDTVLVHAGAGGVGLLLTQLAIAKGVRVITTVSTDEKETLSREAGAAEVLRYDDDLAEQVRALTGGDGVAAVYDGVGASTFERRWHRCASGAPSRCSGPRAVRCPRSICSVSTRPGHCSSPVPHWRTTR